MKKFLLPLLVTLLCAAAQAQEIRDIETTVHLFRSGNAFIVQKWDLNVTKGTEWYIPVENLGQCNLKDFWVFENDEQFIDEGDSWNSNRPMAEKAGRSGIVRKKNGGLELCWGLGSYGDHDFHIMYVIENMVQDYGDCDAFHWHFLNDEWSVKPKHASITFVNQTETEPWYWASPDSCNVRFWGFGMAGKSALEDGVIRFESTEPFAYDSFFSALMQFDKGLFQPTVKGKGSFKKLKKAAMKGSDYKKNDDSFSEKLDRFFENVIFYGFLILVGLVLLWILYRIFQTLFWIISGRRFDKDVFGKTAIKGWWRDIPLDGTPTALYSILYLGDKVATNPHKRFPNLVSAYFLKWIQEGLLVVEKDLNKEDRVNLRFVQEDDNPPVFADKMEETVYNAALKAAGKNRLLEENEFRDWSEKNDTVVNAWPTEAAHQGRDRWQKFSEQERCHAVEFRNFLNDYTLVKDRQAPEVGLWKQYMVLAAAMGIAHKVAKNFEKLFPQMMEEYTRQTNMSDAATTYLIMDQISRSSVAMVSTAHNRVLEREAAAREARRAASGGGGSISRGGGGGGFGGGHGGGAR